MDGELFHYYLNLETYGEKLGMKLLAQIFLTDGVLKKLLMQKQVTMTDINIYHQTEYKKKLLVKWVIQVWLELIMTQKEVGDVHQKGLTYL